MSHFDFLQSILENINSIDSVSGGDINEVYKVKLENTSILVKVNERKKFPSMFQKELEGLELLAKNSSFRIPDMFGVYENDTYQALKMEFIMETSPNSTYNQSFGESLAKMHQETSENYGLKDSNYIGSFVQSNDFCQGWDEFLQIQRLLPMIKMAVDSGKISLSESRKFKGFNNRINELIPKEEPALIHGDLWSGNAMSDEKGNPVLIDPAVYFGHREMEIGMMNLFGGFDSEIFDVYNEFYPLETSWELRVSINQLYPLMVHVNLFGRSYWPKVERILKPYIINV